MVLGAKRLGYGGDMTMVWEGGQTARIENRGKTTWGETTRGN